MKKGDIGVENAAPQDIREALQNARCTAEGSNGDVLTMEDMSVLGLTGSSDARRRREKLGNLLSIGYGNSRTFLRKLNQFGISREELYHRAGELE